MGDRVTQISDIRQAWETTVAAAIGDTTNVSGWWVDGVKRPRVMLVEDSVGSVDILSDFGAAYATLRYQVVVEETSTDGRAGAQRLDELVSWDHDRSVWAAIRGSTDGVPQFGLSGNPIKGVSLGDAWNVNALELSASLPLTITVVKAEPEEEP